jgi:hypothetical protein
MLIWAEGFDHYGTSPNGGRDAMLAGAWAAFENGGFGAPDISTAQIRSGTNSLRMQFNVLSSDGVLGRRVLGSAELVIGCGLGLYLEALPSVNGNYGFEFRNNSNQCIAFFSIQSDGAIGVYTGSGRTLIAASDPIITASSWQHIEAKCVIDNIVGSIEIRVNGLTVIALTGLNIGTLGATQIAFGMPNGDAGGSSLTFYFDDIVTWNGNGTYNNDFLGPVRVELLMPNADTGVTDWVRNTGSNDYDAIDNIPPDGDTTYLEAVNDTDVSEFGLSDSPVETANIKAIYIPTMGKLIAAGTGKVQTSLISNSVASDGPDQTMTTAYSYWGGVHEVDPDTALPWTKSGIDAATLRIAKTL